MSSTIEEQIRTAECQVNVLSSNVGFANNALSKGQERLESLKQKKAEADAVWPKAGDEYWIIGDNGTPYKSEWGDDQTDRNRMAVDNCFRARGDVETRRSQLLARATILRKIGDRKGRYWPSFDGGECLSWSGWPCNEFACFTTDLAIEIAAMPEFRIAIGLKPIEPLDDPEFQVKEDLN